MPIGTRLNLTSMLTGQAIQRVQVIPCHLNGAPKLDYPFEQWCQVVVEFYTSADYQQHPKIFQGEFNQVSEGTAFKKALKQAITLSTMTDYQHLFQEIAILLHS